MAGEGTITMADGRMVGFYDYGPDEATPVLWSHGGPGSRMEPSALALHAEREGFRVIGIDRPGYGLSTPLSGRSIADWVPRTASRSPITSASIASWLSVSRRAGRMR